MSEYHRNRACTCARCRCSGYTGPTVLVTLGVLFLISEYTRAGIERTWPILLIVIGIVVLIQRNASTEGHIEMIQPGAPPPGTTGGGGQGPSDANEVSHG